VPKICAELIIMISIVIVMSLRLGTAVDHWLIYLCLPLAVTQSSSLCRQQGHLPKFFLCLRNSPTSYQSMSEFLDGGMHDAKKTSFAFEQ